MSKKKPWPTGVPFNNEAPDLLLKKISELESTLRTAKQGGSQNQKAIQFYEGILATMKYAWSYMSDMDWLHKRLVFVQAENDFLKEYAGDLKERLLKYEVIEHMKLSGEFDTVVKAVDEYINNNPELNKTND